jgi:hypothetical protein
MEPQPRRWSAAVSQRPPALVLEPGLFTWRNPERIAASLWRSALSSTARQRSPYASAMAMLCLYINRAGRNLNADQRQVLEQAKQHLRSLGHPDQPRRSR